MPFIVSVFHALTVPLAIFKLSTAVLFFYPLTILSLQIANNLFPLSDGTAFCIVSTLMDFVVCLIVVGGIGLWRVISKPR